MSKYEGIKKIYFVGIKGVGMAALAVIAKEAGISVGGSDVDTVFITDAMLSKHGIVPDVGFEKENIDRFFGEEYAHSLIIATAAHGGLENPQVKYAGSKHIDVLTFGQALGMAQYGTLLNRQDIQGLSVAGSHGKTTTAAMLATVLQTLDQDPSYLIGTSEVSSLGDAGKYGQGNYFVVESDEYVSDLVHDRTPKFHYQHPFGAVITNIDFDHPDVFENVDEVYTAFEKFVKNIQSGGVLAILGDNPAYQRVIDQVGDDVQVLTFGTQEHNTYRVQDIRTSEAGVSYTVIFKGEELGKVTMSVLGTHNAINSLAVVALLHTLRFPFDDIARGLSKFSGSKRRLEMKGVTKNGMKLLDDYAHHPSEVRATYTALRDAYPDKKLVCVFQPHTFSRTKSLIADFADAFSEWDHVILLPIFASAREGAVDEKEQQKLYDQILQKTHGIFIESKQNVVKYCTQEHNSSDTVLVTMGAGDVYSLGEELMQL